MKEKDMRTFKRKFLFKLWIVSSSTLINIIINIKRQNKNLGVNMRKYIEKINR